MSEFMLILPGPADRPGIDPAASDPEVIARQLEACLAALDRIDAGIPAAHLAMAIDRLRIQFNLGMDGSGTD